MRNGMSVSRLVVMVLAAALATGLFTGCATKVANVDPSTEGYISGRWNDSDARAVADELIPQCLGTPWLPEFRGQHGDARPRVVVGDIENNTSEHINKDVFINELQRVLINSGVVRFVADPGVREELMQEVQWQEQMAKGGGVSGDVAEGVSGADFMMLGTLSSVIDQADKKAIVYYKVDLWLIDLRTWEKVWIGSAERKHLVENAKIRY
ncbi:MAG: penicillin-binding protein activator LpoB [Candidatus Eisenbacteria bacterium]|nr:penicillin-binding protein activator LpoB [Candidatus Eisenbacteria bacterium]